MATNLSSKDNPINIIFIGETGVGKTSLTELFLNYNPHKEFNLKDIDQFIKPRLRKDPMESDTIKSSIYTIKLNNDEFKIMDTPGLVDTRGDDARKKNIGEITSMVQRLDYLNCICLVFNGTVARITPLIEFVVKEILKLIPSEVLNNVIVVFTKTSDSLALNFELNSLVQYGLEVSPEHSFMLDNPFCRWQKAKKFGIIQEELVTLTKAFTDSYKVLEKITIAAKNFEPVAAKKFGGLHKIICEVEQDITHLRLNVLNKSFQEKAIEEVKSHKATKEALKKVHLELEQVEEVKIKPTRESNIICSQCSHNCHLSCRCKFTTGIFGNVKSCSRFKKKICQRCEHGADVHLKLCHEFVRVKVRNPQNQEYSSRTIDEEIEELKLKLEQNEEGYQRNKLELETKVTKLFGDLKEFQRIGSNSFLIQVTTKEIQRLTRLLEEVPEFEAEKKKVIKMFDETVEVGKNPFSANDDMKDMQLIWACGMLGVDPNNLQQRIIDTNFEKIVTPRIREREEQFKFYKHAKKILDHKLRE